MVVYAADFICMLNLKWENIIRLALEYVLVALA